jgi:hypothetical protein
MYIPLLIFKIILGVGILIFSYKVFLLIFQKFNPSPTEGKLVLSLEKGNDLIIIKGFPEYLDSKEVKYIMLNKGSSNKEEGISSVLKGQLEIPCNPEAGELELLFKGNNHWFSLS